MKDQELREKVEDSHIRERKVDVSSVSTEEAQALCRKLDGRFKCEWGKVFVVFNPSEVDEI